MAEICKFGSKTSKNGDISLICSIDGENCCLIRWCIAIQNIKMSNNFYKYGCKKVGVKDGKEKES